MFTIVQHQPALVEDTEHVSSPIEVIGLVAHYARAQQDAARAHASLGQSGYASAFHAFA